MEVEKEVKGKGNISTDKKNNVEKRLAYPCGVRCHEQGIFSSCCEGDWEGDWVD